MNPYISVQIIAKENTVFGEKLFRACLGSLAEADYANQLILIDNGCSQGVVDSWMQFRKELVGRGVNTLYLPYPTVQRSDTFASLRNMAMAKTDDETDFIHWIDTDEIYFPEKLTAFKKHLGESPNLAVQVLPLQHFMVVPNMLQEAYPKDVVYRYNLNLGWGKGVHEQIQNRCPGDRLDYDMQYLHFGYCRRQWRIALKWLHYDMIEHGHVGHYIKEWNEDWKPGQTPDNIVSDRLKISKPYTGMFPLALDNEFGNHLLDNEAEWVAYLNTLDSDEFWVRWQEMAEKAGSRWGATADWAAVEAEKSQWQLI